MLETKFKEFLATLTETERKYLKHTLDDSDPSTFEVFLEETDCDDPDWDKVVQETNEALSFNYKLVKLFDGTYPSVDVQKYYDNGYKQGKHDGEEIGYHSGHYEGYYQGYDDGYEHGLEEAGKDYIDED